MARFKRRQQTPAGWRGFRGVWVCLRKQVAQRQLVLPQGSEIQVVAAGQFERQCFQLHRVGCPAAGVLRPVNVEQCIAGRELQLVSFVVCECRHEQREKGTNLVPTGAWKCPAPCPALARARAIGGRQVAARHEPRSQQGRDDEEEEKRRNAHGFADAPG